MFHDRGFHNKINRMRERSLRIVYGDNKYSFEELLRKDKSGKLHHKNLQVLATEICKSQTWIITSDNKQCLSA